MPKGNRRFGRRHQDEPSGSDGRNVPVNEHLLESAVDMLDGLGWTVFELWRQTDDEADKDDRLRFLTEWHDLRRALTVNRPCEFNSYDGAHEVHTNIRYIFRDGSVFSRSEAESSFSAFEAEKNSYAQFLAAYDPDEDPYL